MCLVSLQRRLLGMAGRVMTAEILVILPEAAVIDEAAARAACSAGGEQAKFLRLFGAG